MIGVLDAVLAELSAHAGEGGTEGWTVRVAV
jgi:hypothetical protein